MLLDNKSELNFKNMHVGNLWEAASHLKLIRSCFHQSGIIIDSLVFSNSNPGQLGYYHIGQSIDALHATR